MLNAQHRLRSSEDFRRCVRQGDRQGTRLLVVHLLVDDTLSPEGGTPPRAGFVVSRAVGPAVTRNTVKRRLRHLVREHLTELPHGALLVVRAQPAAAEASYVELGEALSYALTRCLEKVPR